MRSRIAGLIVFAGLIGTVATAAAPDGSRPGAPIYLWPEYRNRDLPALVARFKAENYPPVLMRNIVDSLVGEEFERRANAARRVAEYWQNAERFREAVLDRGPNILLQLNQEKHELRERLRGPDLSWVNQDDERERQIRFFGPMPAAKVEQVKKIVEDYRQLSDEASKTRNYPEAVAKLTLLEREKRADLQRLLTAGELFEYDLRASSSANKLRQHLRWFDATEAEFRAMFPARQAYDARYPEYAMTRPEDIPVRQAAQDDMERQFRAALGEARYADLTLSNRTETDAAERARQAAVAGSDAVKLAVQPADRPEPLRFAIPEDVLGRVMAVVATLPNDPRYKDGPAYPFRRPALFAIEGLRAVGESGHRTIRIDGTIIEVRTFAPDGKSAAVFMQDAGKKVELELIRFSTPSLDMNARTAIMSYTRDRDYRIQQGLGRP